MSKTDEYLSYWYEALAHPVGLCLQVTERKAFAQKLYQARAKARDPDLEALAIVVPKDSDELWIARKEMVP